MKKNSTEKNNNAYNVEFGMEFGDLNASKQYEIPFMNIDKKENNHKNKK